MARPPRAAPSGLCDGAGLCDAAEVTASAGTSEDPWWALLVEAATKSDLLWLRPAGGRRAWPAWHVWHRDAVHVVSGGGEQVLPRLDGPVELLLRSKDTGARLLTVPARAVPLEPDDERWAAAAAALAAARLNASVPPSRLPDLWRDTATVTRVEAVGPPLEEPGQYSADSHAAPPAPTPATSGRRP